MYDRPSPTTDTWIDERVEQLTNLWSDGLSATQIAAIMGEGITRNAVIGKVTRLQLNKTSPHRTSADSRRQQTQVNNRNAGAGKPRPAVQIGPRTSHRNKNSTNGASIKHRIETRRDVYAEMDADVGIDVTHLLGRGACDATMKLTVHTCKWPVGDPMHPAFGYCGQPPIEGKPYCETHARRAYVQVG